MAYDPYKALYLHIPFCVRRCGYCDFATSAVERDSPIIDEYVESLVMDIRRASREEKLGAIETVYLGGGTPSYIGMRRLSMLLYALSMSMHLEPEVECTMEANPESLTAPMVRDIWALGVNRLSIGVQSFDDEVLRILGRAHDAEAARAAVRAAQERFENVSVDLMCGIPGQSAESFAESVREAVALGANHVSVYPLTIEPHTPFDRAIMRGEMDEPDEDVEAAAMEEARLITPAILTKYLPGQSQSGASTSMSTALHSGPGDGVSFERELLYKVLFDLRADVNDLKRMLTELMQRAERPAEPTKDLAGLLPASAHSIASPDYTESEEVVDEQPSRELTKADVLREQILRALRRNNGRRREAAAELFMSERTLYRKIKELGIDENS